MSPLSVPDLTRRRDGRKATNPKRAGGPERDQPISPILETPGRARTVDVTPRSVKGEAPRTKATGRDGEGERPGGGNPRKASARASRKGRPRTDSHRERGPEAGRARPLPRGAGEPARATARGQGPREGHPSRARRTPWRVKPMDAPTPSGAGRDGGGRREGGRNLGRGTRSGAGLPAITRVRRPGTCRRARKPRRGSIVRPAGSPGGTVRGCGDGPL